MDKDRVEKHRLILGECAQCYRVNRNAISGRAMTKYTCRICTLCFMHPNTAIPSICLDCSNKKAICTRCMQSLDL